MGWRPERRSRMFLEAKVAAATATATTSAAPALRPAPDTRAHSSSIVIRRTLPNRARRKPQASGATSKWRRRRQRPEQDCPVRLWRLLLVVALGVASAWPTVRARDTVALESAATGAWKPTLSFRSGSPLNQSGRRQHQHQSLRQQQQDYGARADELPEQSVVPLQVSITPRVSLIRVPVENNAILKCLISSQAPQKFQKRFTVRWSRFLHQDNVYELIEPPPPPQLAVGAAHTPTTEQQSVGRMRDFLSRSRQETNAISELLLEATLAISSVKPADNATYFCAASDGRLEHSEARIELVALHRPSVRLERLVPARDSKSALVHWLVLADGNTPIKKTILMVRNESVIRQSAPVRLSTAALASTAQEPAPHESGPGSGALDAPLGSIVMDDERHQWQRIDIGNENDLAPLPTPARDQHPLGSSPDDNVVRADVDVTSIGATQHQPQAPPAGSASGRHKQRSHNLTNLLPGVTYNLRLAAINDMGQSEWSYLSASMPNEIPAQISEVFLLSRSNDSLAIGWRRPAYDSAKTVRYELQLLDLNRTLTLDANTNTSASSHRTNFMYIFVNLAPGTDYHFHVRACSRAGCSAYSVPKLLASTMDGEPDEPLDVELTCHPDSGNVTISWLPPVNVRGQLLNYSVSLHSRANYLNQSGAWAGDEWRTTMETSDNHTLVLEASGLLMPNTNYTAQVCANNRSKHCGRLNQPTARAQCSTPPELPGEIPAGLRLWTRADQDSNSSSGGQTASASTGALLLDLPFISRRNGTLNCVQLVLVRLPLTFDGSSSSLADFLPADPRDLKLSSPASPAPDPTGATPSPELPLAYLADQFEPSSALPAPPSAHHQIVLGDGRQHSGCKSLPTPPGGDHSKLRPLDAQLRPRTYYAAFVRLLLVRRPPQSSPLIAAADPTSGAHFERQQVDQSKLETLVKYSHYLGPVRTGERVPEIPVAGDDEWPAKRLANYLNVSLPDGLAKLATDFKDSISVQIDSLYKFASDYAAQNVKLDAVSKFIAQSSPLMQLFEIGVLTFLALLLLIFLIYLATLPAAARRRKRLRLKRKLQQHEASAAAAAVVTSAGSDSKPQDDTGGFLPVAALPQPNGLQLATGQSHQQVTSGGGQLQQQQQQQSECPVHYSPQANAQGQVDAMLAGNERRPSLHVCPQPQPQAPANPQPIGPLHQSQILQHHLYATRPGYNPSVQSVHSAQPQPHPHQHPLYAGHYHVHNHAHFQPHHQHERECKTLKRSAGHQTIVQVSTSEGQFGDGNGTCAAHSQLVQAGNLTLSRHHNSLLALAKKINKSIPLRVFGQVFELRVRNGWLRDEYESLPRAQISAEMLASAQSNGPVKVAGPQVKLRPQLIVSRNDTMSALISGNERYDASLLKLAPTPLTGASSANNGQSERRIICARSPLDANSVWDFWRLIYEQEVSTIVMLTQNEDPATGETRCAHYWPTHDNEETTILSPRNELVLASDVLPAKFKIRLETLEAESSADNYQLRRLTLLVMATRATDNEEQPAQCSGGVATNGQQQEAASAGEDEAKKPARSTSALSMDDDELVIVERDVLQVQFYHWNTSTPANQMRLVRFVEMVHEKHARNAQLESPGATGLAANPILVHCINGLGRSGVFAAMSFVLDELRLKLRALHQQPTGADQQSAEPKINLYQLVSRLRQQRELVVSPYRFYELLYQLTSNCIPNGRQLRQPQQQQ